MELDGVDGLGALAADVSLEDLSVLVRPEPLVVSAPGQAPVPAEVIAFSRARLVHFKCPRQVRLVDALPRNALGKILRDQLVEP